MKYSKLKFFFCSLLKKINVTYNLKKLSQITTKVLINVEEWYEGHVKQAYKNGRTYLFKNFKN